MSLLRKATIGVLGIYSAAVFSGNERANTEVKAIARVSGKEVQGSFEFLQQKYTLNTQITGEVRGLYPDHKHGVQIHEGEPGNVGGIFNPFAKKHGGPWNPERKVGDLGNLQVDHEGVGKFEISDPFVKLSGPFSVVSKVIAVHENADDLGFVKNAGSTVDGNVGKVLAAGSIQQE